MNKTSVKHTIASLALVTFSQAALAEPSGNATSAVSSENDNILRLEPTLHLRLAHGSTTLPNDEIELGGHDPSQDNFNFQAFEIGANIYIGDHLKGFATVNTYKQDGEDFESEFEEGFLKLDNLPGGLELRGGRMLARFGDQNARHLHAWDFADANMTTVQLSW